MMTREERRAKCESFIKSDSVSLDTWMIIHNFLLNADTILYTIKTYQNLVKDLDNTENAGRLDQQVVKSNN